MTNHVPIFSASRGEFFRKKFKQPPRIHGWLVLFFFIILMPSMPLLAVFDVFSHFPKLNIDFWMMHKLDDFAKTTNYDDLVKANERLWLSIIFPFLLFFLMLSLSIITCALKCEKIVFKPTKNLSTFGIKIALIFAIFFSMIFILTYGDLRLCRFCRNIDYSQSMHVAEYVLWQMKPMLFMVTAGCAFIYLALFTDFEFTDK